ncbi:MAG: diguanylate cyclase [Nitrospiraceae bacterium]|nr:MAG: diguanylate cyclase [Nitrospiraceae bacterium]
MQKYFFLIGYRYSCKKPIYYAKLLKGRAGMLNLPLRSIVNRENLVVSADSSLADLIKLMHLNQKGVVVVLRDEKPAGIMTERDIVEVLYNKYDLNERVEKYAIKSLVTTRGDRTVGYALNLMIENHIRRVIVIDEEEHFIGIATHQDLLKHVEEDFYRQTIKIKHILNKSRALISIAPEESLRELLKKMIDNRISAVPVVQENKPIGIISEKDILKFTSENVSLSESVEKYMSSPVETASLDSPLAEIVEVMNYENIRRVVVVDREGCAIGMVTIRDVMENLEGDYNKFLEQKLKNAKEILNLLPEMLVEVVDTGEEQLIIWANEKVVSLFGREILDKDITGFIPAEYWNRIYAALKKLNKIERIKLKKDNRIFELSGFFLKTYGKAEEGRVQLLMRDITEDIKLSTIDPLTNVYNRRFINGFMMKEIERCKRTNSHFSIVISDIDDFKTINDTFGHLSGDIALKGVSQIIAETIRNVDVVGRYGGDEFMIILPETSGDIASYVIDRIRHRIEIFDIVLQNGIAARITASFGIATFPDDGLYAEDLLVVADERLYKAKSLGKNKVACV